MRRKDENSVTINIKTGDSSGIVIDVVDATRKFSAVDVLEQATNSAHALLDKMRPASPPIFQEKVLDNLKEQLIASKKGGPTFGGAVAGGMAHDTKKT